MFLQLFSTHKDTIAWHGVQGIVRFFLFILLVGFLLFLNLFCFLSQTDLHGFQAGTLVLDGGRSRLKDDNLQIYINCFFRGQMVADHHNLILTFLAMRHCGSH